MLSDSSLGRIHFIDMHADGYDVLYLMYMPKPMQCEERTRKQRQKCRARARAITREKCQHTACLPDMDMKL